MKAKEIAIWTGVLAILLGGLWLLIMAVNSSPSSSKTAEITAPEVSKDDYIRGDKEATISAKVTLIEYGDFQCPACKQYHPVIKRIEADFPKDLKVIYRFFPLTTVHQNAMLAAQAAYAAGLQNKFWEMHDLLYDNQDSWSNTQPKNIFIDYAKKLGLDAKKFESDIDASSTKKFIIDEQNKSLSVGINSTPTFFVNGKSIANPPGYDAFKKVIQDEINKN